MDERLRFYLYALTFLNVPYRWGGSNPLQGLDCSGLVQLLLAYLGLDPPGDQTADALYRHFTARMRGTIHLDKTGKITPPELGDLLFYGKPEKLTHVAMALDGQRMIEAGGGGSRTLSLLDAIRDGAYVKVSQISRRDDLVAVVRPTGLPWD